MRNKICALKPSVNYTAASYMRLCRSALLSSLMPVMILLLITTGQPGCFGQDATPSPSQSPEQKSDEEIRLEQENKILTLKKTQADLKKAIREDQPQPTATPLEGKSTLDDKVFIETEILSYKAMSHAVAGISNEIHTRFGNATKIVILNNQDMQDLLYYRRMFPNLKSRLKGLRESYVEILGKPAGGVAALDTALEAGSTAVRAFVDLISMFRTDTEVKGREVTINDRALTAEMLRALRNDYGSTVELYNPAVFPPQFFEIVTPPSATTSPTPAPPATPIPVLESAILKELGDTYVLHRDAVKAVVKLTLLKATLDQRKQLKTDIDARNKTIDEDRVAITEINAKLHNPKLSKDEKETLEAQLKQKQNEIDRLTTQNTEATSKDPSLRLREDRLVTQILTIGNMGGPATELHDPVFVADKIDEIKGVNGSFDAVVADITKADDKSGVSPLAIFFKSEGLDSIVRDKNNYWLALEAIKAGGNNRTQRNLIRYFSGAKISHSGGAIVTYTIYNREGAIQYSDKRSIYEGYTSASKIKELEDTVR